MCLLACPCSRSLPAGVPTEMIEQYVQEILQNDDINIKALPDSIERVIYVSTVRLTLNAVSSLSFVVLVESLSSSTASS